MSRTLFSLAGFQVIISGRFWVIAEVWATASLADKILTLFMASSSWKPPTTTRSTALTV
jgi:hypothetical protein